MQEESRINPMNGAQGNQNTTILGTDPFRFLRCRGVAGAVQWLCYQVCQCVATKCVAALPSPVPSAVQKSSNPVRSKASGCKKPILRRESDDFVRHVPAHFAHLIVPRQALHCRCICEKRGPRDANVHRP